VCLYSSTVDIWLWTSTKLCWGRDFLFPPTVWFHLLLSVDT
jgi:hypothetical protein